MSFTHLKCEYRGMVWGSKKNICLHFSLGFMSFASFASICQKKKNSGCHNRIFFSKYNMHENKKCSYKILRIKFWSILHKVKIGINKIVQFSEKIKNRKIRAVISFFLIKISSLHFFYKQIKQRMRILETCLKFVWIASGELDWN